MFARKGIFAASEVSDPVMEAIFTEGPEEGTEDKVEGDEHKDKSFFFGGFCREAVL